MFNHQLRLHIEDTSNEKILKISDTSTYSDLIGVSCPQLLITAPGYQFSANISSTLLVQGFDLVLTACQLEIQTVNCDSVFSSIPDGVYAIGYSVSPNDSVKVEYNHLRLVQTYNRIYKIECDLDIPNGFPDKLLLEKLERIRLVRSYLNAAKARIEFKHNIKEGIRIFNLAKKMLDNLDCKNCG